MGNCLHGVTRQERSVATVTKSARGNMLRQRVGKNIDEYYEILGTIGRGSIGNVCRCRHKETGKTYALKTIKTTRMSKEMVDELMNEIDILMGLDHPNIVRPLELFSRRRDIFFIMPLCSGGDLYKRAPYAEDEAARIVGMVVDTLAYMHSHGVVHRDIKFENVLFASKAFESEVMVIDFGLAKANYAVKKQGKLDEFVGTLYSMAPEVIRGSYDEKCDVWSLGVITYMLLAGAMPFTRFDDERKFLRDLEAQRYDMNRKAMLKKSDDAKNFVKSLLVANPQKRPNMAKVKKHPWILGRRRSVPTAESMQAASAQPPKPSSSRRLYSDDRIAEHLANYAASSKLRKIALMVVAHRADVDSLRDLREAFRAIDTTNEGTINFDELKVVLEKSGMSPKNIKMTFDAVDYDGTGKISYTEFIAACIEGSSHCDEDLLAEAFDRLDSDDSGYISKQNLRDILGNQFSQQLVEEMIADADFKKNGRVDFEEFINLMHNKRDRIRVEKDTMSQPPPASTTAAVAKSSS